MKKVSTVAAKQSSDFSNQRLTIGLDLGDCSSHYCVLEEAGRNPLREQSFHEPQCDEDGVRGDGAQSDRAGNRDAFAVGPSASE